MDIYLKEKQNTKSQFQFPSLPEMIKIKGSANYQEYDIIKKGTYAFPAGFDIRTFQWSGYFWGKTRQNDRSLNRKWMAPMACANKLKAWMEKGTVLNLVISGGGINKDVTIKSLDCTQMGGNGDMEYSITLVLYRPLKIYTTDELGTDTKKTTKKKTVAREETKPKKKQYTVVYGDNLWSIAMEYYGGSGEDWKKIYDANKEIIESTAKKHGYSSSDNGWWIFPGCVLVIP